MLLLYVPGVTHVSLHPIFIRAIAGPFQKALPITMRANDAIAAKFCRWWKASLQGSMSVNNPSSFTFYLLNVYDSMVEYKTNKKSLIGLVNGQKVALSYSSARRYDYITSGLIRYPGQLE
jgi:hypothetical protein